MPAGRGAASAAPATAAALRPDRAAPSPGDERPQLGLVEQQRSRRRVRIAVTSSAVLLFGSMLGLAAFHSVLVQGQLRIDQLDQRITAAEHEQTQLRLRVAQLGAPQRIVIAAGDLGMVIPDDRVYLAAVVPGNVVPPPPTTKAPSARAATTPSTPAAGTGAAR